MHGLQAPWSQVTSARGLAETGSREGGEAAENYPDLLNHEWHHSRGTSARSADCVHNPGKTKPVRNGMEDNEPEALKRRVHTLLPLTNPPFGRDAKGAESGFILVSS